MKAAPSGLAAFLLAEGADNDWAVVSADGTQPLTYRELSDQSADVAARLKTMRIGSGDKVALHLPNTPAFAVALFAVLRLGASVVPVHPAAAGAELATQLVHTCPDLVITTPEGQESVRAAAEPSHIPVFAFADQGETAELAIEAGSGEDTSVDLGTVHDTDPAVIAFTSGTSGATKAAVLTHRGITANLQQAATSLPLANDDVLLALAPFAHVMGLCGHLFRGLAAGATVVTLDSFHPTTFVHALSSYRITQAILPPSVIAMLATHPVVDEHDLSALRVLYVGGSGAEADVERACAERLGCIVAQGYGMTEGGPMITVNPITDHGKHVRYGSAGTALPEVHIRVVDPDTSELAPVGEVGEVLVHTPSRMSGYLAEAETTANIDRYGWFHTGDLGYQDEDGYLWLTGRLKEMIKHNGYQVVPAEIEAVLKQHPDVADAAVVGIPDPHRGERPVAVVVSHTTVSVEDVLAFVASQVSPQKRPHAVHTFDAIPRNRSGKISRTEIQQTLNRLMAGK